MTLDITATAEQVAAMAGQLAAQAERMRPLPEFAHALMLRWHERHEDAVSYLEGAEQRGVWPFAVPIEPLLTTRPAPAMEDQSAVVATDGSQIDVDTHGLVHCYLINIGWAAIAYGPSPEAWLASAPVVHHDDQDLFALSEDGEMLESGESQLSMQRAVAEMEQLAELAESWRDRPGLVAVADGSLVHWELGGKSADEARALLLRRYTTALARFRDAGIPLCSYISRPNAREVTNAAALLALHDCDRGSRAQCAQCECRPDRLCELLRVLADRDLFPRLRPGESSAMFRALSPVMQSYAPDDRIVFCYLRNEADMGRVEMPLWASRPPYRDRVLATIHDQCSRGRGYPVVLMEAHEQAVIHGGGREAFRELVLSALNARDLPAAVSGKRLSKDQRAV
jgi:hypothetical protein